MKFASYTAFITTNHGSIGIPLSVEMQETHGNARVQLTSSSIKTQADKGFIHAVTVSQLMNLQGFLQSRCLVFDWRLP